MDKNILNRKLITGFYKSTRKKVQLFHHKYFDNFIFIHINKTGGSSIERALRIPTKHSTAIEKIREIGREEWDKKFTFTVIRNPWDKVVSQYHYRIQLNQIDLKVDPLDFSKWVKLTYGERDPMYYNWPKMFKPQSDWITDDDGVILVKFVCRFENLHDDFREVCKHLDKEIIDLPHIKRSRRKKYKDYYNEETMRIVEDWFEKDIKNFGYEF